MLKVHDEHNKSNNQTNITQVTWPLTHCLQKHSIFILQHSCLQNYPQRLLGYRNGRNNNNLCSHQFDAKKPVASLVDFLLLIFLIAV